MFSGSDARQTMVSHPLFPALLQAINDASAELPSALTNEALESFNLTRLQVSHPSLNTEALPPPPLPGAPVLSVVHARETKHAHAMQQWARQRAAYLHHLRSCSCDCAPDLGDMMVNRDDTGTTTSSVTSITNTTTSSSASCRDAAAGSECKDDSKEAEGGDTDRRSRRDRDEKRLQRGQQQQPPRETPMDEAHEAAPGTDARAAVPRCVCACAEAFPGVEMSTYMTQLDLTLQSNGQSNRQSNGSETRAVDVIHTHPSKPGSAPAAPSLGLADRVGGLLGRVLEAVEYGRQCERAVRRACSEELEARQERVGRAVVRAGNADVRVLTEEQSNKQS